MNDENSVLQTAQIPSCQACDTLETEGTQKTDACNDVRKESAPAGREDEADLDVFADSGTDLDSDCQDSDPTPQESELEQLRSELKQLKEELAQRDARLMKEERIEREYAEFSQLYPDVSVTALPQEVWQSVESGTSLAAAYALAERRNALSLKKATDSNANNRARSAGAISNAESIEFSPAEVRAMSPSEVRANLPKIMRSMRKWH